MSKYLLLCKGQIKPKADWHTVDSCLFFGRIYGAAICLRFYLTFIEINIGLIKKFSKSVDFLIYKFIELHCRISKFDEILFTARLYEIGAFLHPWKSHAQHGSSDSTPRILTLNLPAVHPSRDMNYLT